ncbi:MAG: class I SAM-dependent methyltransferase [Bacteroidales bacterium]|nr:class I SAM-dependent methyltransferase [Bacteroidales bacterium]
MNRKAQQILAMANHLIHSKSRYSVHSPFVYKLITKGVKPGIPAEKATMLDEFRRELAKTEAFHSRDLGTGQNRLLDGKALQNMSVNKWNGRILFNLCRYFQSKNILELGTSAGLSAAYLSFGNPNASILTIEGCPEKTKIASGLFRQFHLNNIDIINSDAAQHFSRLQKDNYRADLIFIDADHSYQGATTFFRQLLPFTHQESIMIFDDIYWSEAMTKAWMDISNHQQVTLSVSTLQFGIIFFKAGIQKQHFRIRM